MSSAKEEMLQRIKSALQNVPPEETPDDIPVDRGYRQQGELSEAERIDLFVERAGEYKATVKRVKIDEIENHIADACRNQNAIEMAIPAGFEQDWLPESIQPHYDTSSEPLSHEELDQVDGVISTCALAVAQTGTIILDAGPGQGRRVLSLLPDYHLCIVMEDQIVELIPEGFSHFNSVIKDDGPPITFISGPSATSDIELSRVEGVHGPRRLDILVVKR